ncbi:MAG: hypothetical protein ABI602_00905 [Candidatus Saccharibacteria bacterium]
MPRNISHDRLIKNEQIVREHNSRTTHHLRKLLHNDKVAVASPLNFICECSNLECQALVALSIQHYEAIHQRRDRFVINVDHLAPSVEKIVEQRAGYAIVEKFELSAETDS